MRDFHYTAENWQEFLDAIRKSRQDLGNPAHVWYRGHSRERFKLVPSLVRSDLALSKEQLLFNEFERSALRFMPRRANDWELLIDMQHYGIPTRLLDWTDVLGVAVAFALYDSDDGSARAIYVLDPLRLNEFSGLKSVKRVPNDQQFGYKSIYWEGKPFMAVHPIAIDSQLINDRIAAQSGYFTVHGANRAPMEEQADGCIRKIVLQPSAIASAREFLEYANLNPFSIYPDIVGMARHIARKHLEGG